mgnify:CR=1 FL=1
MGLKAIGQEEKNYTKASKGLKERARKNKEAQKKRKAAATQYGNTDYEFEVQNTLTEPTKRANTLEEGKKLLDKTKARKTSKNELERKRAAGYLIKKTIKKSKGGSAGSKLVASYYKGGII